MNKKMNKGVTEHSEELFENIYNLLIKLAKTGCSTDNDFKTLQFKYNQQCLNKAKLDFKKYPH